MVLTALDVLVLLVIGAAAVMGALRGFVSEVLTLLAWVLIVLALKFLHTPVTAMLAGPVGTDAGAAVLAFALIAGITYFGGRMLARAIGARMRDSFIGPIDRALGFGFGAVKGLILVSLAFLVLVLLVDTVSGGADERPDWITQSTTYPLLNATSASIADFVDRRRRGEPVFGSEEDGNTVAGGNAGAAGH